MFLAGSRGFFGLFALLLCIQAMLLISSSQLRGAQDYSLIDQKILAVEKSGFERAQSELFLDAAILRAISGPHLGPLEAARIKSGVNASILSAPQVLGIGEFYECSESIPGQIQSAPLDPEGLDAISEVVVLKAGPVMNVQYILSAGQRENIFPCVKISNAGHSLFLRIPAGYFASAAVLSG